MIKQQTNNNSNEKRTFAHGKSIFTTIENQVGECAFSESLSKIFLKRFKKKNRGC